MPQEELRTYIQQESDKKFSREQITQMLLTHGYSEAEISSAFEELAPEKEAPAAAPAGPTPVARDVPHHRSLLIIILVIMFVIGGSYMIFLGVSGPDDDGQTTKNDTKPIVPVVEQRTMTPEERERFVAMSVDACTKELAEYSDTACRALVRDDQSVCAADRMCIDTYLLYTSVASGASRCDGIGDRELRELCVAYASGAGCAQYSDDLRSYCEAVTGLTAVTCGSISSVTAQQECRDAVALVGAFRANDPSGCAGIRDDYKMKDRCVGYLTKNETACALQSQCEDQAYGDIAVMTGNPEQCDQIRDSVSRENCRSAIA